MSLGSAERLGVVKKPNTLLAGTAPPALIGQLLPHRLGLSLALSVTLNRFSKHSVAVLLVHDPVGLVCADEMVTAEQLLEVAPPTSKLPMFCVVPDWAATEYVLNV